MPEKLKPVDVVVVGLGAAGGTAVWPLAEAGLKVVGHWFVAQAGGYYQLPDDELPRHQHSAERDRG